MNGYLVFVTISLVTLLSPGPGVLFTITNSINYGRKTAFWGILGLIIGMFIIAVISASGVGLLIVKNPTIFKILKYIGAFYLMYLGYMYIIKKSIPLNFINNEPYNTKNNIFYQGLFASLLNPKTIVFFIALFPQFINTNKMILNQFFILSLTFCTIGMLIHLIYSNFSFFLKDKISSRNNLSKLNKASGIIFFLLAILLIFQ